MNKLIGVPLSEFNEKQLVDWVLNGQGFYRYILTPNVEHIVMLSKSESESFINAYNNVDLAVLDSKVIGVIIEKLHKVKIPVIPGSDLTSILFSGNQLKNYKVAIIGCDTKDIEILKSKYNIPRFFHHNPPIGFIDNNEEVKKCIEFVKQYKPEFLFIAVGAPRQEILAFFLKKYIDFNCTALCVGASINFLTGKERRAPELMQKYALEWLYRLIKDPVKRYKRYIIDGPAIFSLMTRDDFFLSK